MVATEGGPGDPAIIHTSRICGAEVTSSYEDERTNPLLALDWASFTCPTELCSESQSLVKANLRGTPATQHILQRLGYRKSPTILI